MNHNDIGSIMEQLENMGLLYDTGERRNGEVVFELRWEPWSKKMDELYHYMQSEPAAYEFLVEVWRAHGLDPGEISVGISKHAGVLLPGDFYWGPSVGRCWAGAPILSHASRG